MGRMTKEKAIKILKPMLDSFVDYANITMRVEDDNIVEALEMAIEALEQPETIRCKDCKHWKQQTNYKGVLLSFGFCESDDMWRSLYGETYEVSHIDTDDDFYCGYAERRTDDDT